MSMRKKLSLLRTISGLGAVVFASLSLSPALAQFQTAESVAATVNEQMISTFDVSQRMRLMLLTSGGRIPESAYAQLQQKALVDLVEEKLKLIEAQRIGFDVEQSMIDAELANIAGSVGGTVPQLKQQLLAQGIAPSTLEDQVRSRLVWQRLVSAKYRGRVRVDEDEIDSVLARLEDDSQKEQLLLSEICLPIENPAATQQIYNAGMQMIEQMQNGVPFDALAQQFSVCSSAATGGERGWSTIGELDPELGAVVSKLEAGSVSVPTAHDGLMYIFAVRQKRPPAIAGPKKFQFAYAGAPLSIGLERASTAFADLKLTNVCNGDELSVDLGDEIGVTMMQPLEKRNIFENFHTAIDNLERGEITPTITTDNGYHALLLCSVDSGLGLPSRKSIEDKLSADQLELLARRYLRDIKRENTVDVRIGA